MTGTDSAEPSRASVESVGVVWAFSIFESIARDTPLRPASWLRVQSRWVRNSRSR